MTRTMIGGTNFIKSSLSNSAQMGLNASLNDFSGNPGSFKLKSLDELGTAGLMERGLRVFMGL